VSVVAGADAAFSWTDDLVFAAVVTMSFPELKSLEMRTAVKKGIFPYVPGLLTFREGPALLEAFRKLEKKPDLIFFDGQGLAHPRRLGLASHLGLFLDTPSIGCAKTRLVGRHKPPPEEKGNWTELTDKGELVGAVLRTRTGVSPVFVSVGHRIDLDSAISLTLSACGKYRLPEPIRKAHRQVTRLKTEALMARSRS
jgi:deoxyribonuclease V